MLIEGFSFFVGVLRDWIWREEAVIIEFVREFIYIYGRAIIFVYIPRDSEVAKRRVCKCVPGSQYKLISSRSTKS